MPPQIPTTFQDVFENPEHAAKYADGPAKFMPGFQDVQKMAMILLRESVPENAHILVHGAGGGLEMEVFAQQNAHWSFTGVDPAKAMLDEASKRMSNYSNECHLHCGYIETAPDGPFDGATSLLTLHFLDAETRLQTLKEIVKRLKPGAPFIAAHSSFPQTEPERSEWLNRYAEFGILCGTPAEAAHGAKEAISNMLSMLSPETDEALLAEAGLRNITQFYSAFTWRGWLGYAAKS